jgi:transposase
MLQISPANRVYVVHESISFNLGFKGMIGFCRNILGVEPMTGEYFVFRSKTKKQVRILTYDGDGWWLATKVFSKGRIHDWLTGDGRYQQLPARDLMVLLWRGSIKQVQFPDFWKRIDTR